MYYPKFPTTFKLDWFGRALDVYMRAGKREQPEYPLVPRDTEVYLRTCDLHQRFPNNPFKLLLHVLANGRSRCKTFTPTKRKTPRGVQGCRQRAARVEILEQLMAPLLFESGHSQSFISIADLKTVLHAVLDNWEKLTLTPGVYIERCGVDIHDPDALYIDKRKWFEFWAYGLTADLTPTKEDRISFYADWVQQMLSLDVCPKADVPEQPEEDVHTPPALAIPNIGEPCVVQLAPTRSVGQQMSLRPDDIIAEPKTTLTLKTDVIVNHATTEEVRDIVERIQLFDDSGAKFSVGNMGTLTVEIEVPTYCGYPVGDGDHSTAIATAAQHIDNVLRLVEVARNMQESQRRVENLAEAYSGR